MLSLLGIVINSNAGSCDHFRAGKLRMVKGQREKVRPAILVVVLTVAATLTNALRAEAREITPDVTTKIQSRLSGLLTSDPQALARALRVASASKEPPPGFAQNYLEDLGDLEGDGVSEFVLEWTGDPAADAQAAQAAESLPGWSLFVVAWNGTAWKSSPLMGGFEPFTVEVLPETVPGEREIAVVVYAGSAAAAYPAIFRFKDHGALLAWDGRSDESLYQGFDNGQLQFSSAGGALQMTEIGRADPGFLKFPKNGRRGFDLRSVYRWNGKAFVPAKTEYSQNADFILYRFIAALHLRDFQTAYSLTDPAKFLKSDKPTLETFRRVMEEHWREFLDDRIFRARDSGESDAAFELRLDDKLFVYTPSFGGDSGLLLTGLERQERQPESE